MTQTHMIGDRDDTHKLSAAALARLAAHDRATAHLRDPDQHVTRDRPAPA